MIDEQIHVAIKSYKRAGIVTTLEVVPFGWLWVPESQGAAYEEHYPGRVLTIPDELDGNISKKINAILDRSPCPWVMMLDDDISNIGYWEDAGHHWMDPDEIEQFMIHHFILAQDLGVEMWGINQGKDEMWYMTYTPFSLLAPILGPFVGHLEPVLRYDERINYKEDYDFWLMNIEMHRKTLRANKYHYLHDHGELRGGLVSSRSMEKELKAAEMMHQKWGPIYGGVGGSAGGKLATGRNILNSKIRIPLPGC